MELEFLGTGAGMPSKNRNTSSLILNLADEGEGYWMFDCGEATQHQLLYTSTKPRKINTLFITHLHGDHIFGLPGFLSSRSFLGGDDPLTIYGPAGLEQWIRQTLRLTSTYLPYELIVHEVKEGVLFETDQFRVLCQRVNHVVPSYGFRIEQNDLPGTLLIEKALAAGVPKGPLLKQLKDGHDVELADGRIVRSREVTEEPKKGFVLAVIGDTSYCESSIELARDADILVHEATFDDSMRDAAKEFGHSTIAEAAEIAKEANVKALIVNHISARFLPSELPGFLAQGTDIFSNLFIAEDFSRFQWRNDELITVPRK